MILPAMDANPSAESAQEQEPQRGIVVSTEELAAILRQRGWSVEDSSPEFEGWLAEAAALLGPQSDDHAMLADLLGLVFQYDANKLLRVPAHQAVITRQGAREVIRRLASMVLAGPAVDSDRYKEIVAELRAATGLQGQRLFFPVRLALAGRAGGGPLDRVILLLDRAAPLPFRARVKSNRQRLLEFCAAMD